MSEIGNKISKADIDLIDESLDRSQSVSYNIFIQIESGRLSFCVYNTALNKYIVLRSYPLFANDSSQFAAICRSIFENDDLLGLKYKNSACLWVSSRYTLVPAHLFLPEEADTYLTFSHGKADDEQVLHCNSQTANLQHVFSCPAELITLVRTCQPFVRFFHQSAPFIESAVACMPATNKVDVAIFFYGHWLDILVMKNNRLLFYNSFQINAPADSLYYLLGVTNLFDTVLLSTKITYAGTLKPMPPEIAILKGYVDSITECEPSNAVAYSNYITEPFRKKFVHLFNLLRCE